MSTKRKQCKKCLRILSVKKFYRHPTTADRLFPCCKADHARAALCRYRERPEVRRRAKEWARRWKKQNPLKAKAQQAAAEANRRAAKRGVPGRLTGRDVIGAWEASGYRCAVCKKDLSKKDGDLSLDHQHPLEFGGPNTPNNLRAVCRSCNAKEYWKWWRECGGKRAA